MFEKSVFLTIFLILGLTTGHPTMYKLNENDKLEAGMIHFIFIITNKCFPLKVM